MEDKNALCDLNLDGLFEQNSDEAGYNGLNDLIEDDREFLISILSGMSFTPPYKEYVVKTLKKIINDNIVVNKNIFTEKKISQEDLFKILSEKLSKQANENNRSQGNIKTKSLNMNQLLNNQIREKSNDINVNDNIKNETNKEKKNTRKNQSTMDTKNIIDNEENKIIMENAKSISINDNSENNDIIRSFNPQINNENKIFDNDSNTFTYSGKSSSSSVLLNSNSLFDQTKSLKMSNNNKNIVELKTVEDTFNLNGDMYELFVQSMIFLTLKCFEQDNKNKFNFFFNVKKNMGKIKDIADIELDFVISNLDANLFKSFLKHFKDNIIFFKYNNNSFEITINKKDNSLNNIIENIDKSRKIDIIGEIGQSAWKDIQKAKQFEKNCSLMKFLENEDSKKNNQISNLNKYLKFETKNQKLILFVTDSPYEYIFKNIQKSELLTEMKKTYTENDKKLNVNSILLFLSLGLEERALINDYIIKKKKNNDDNILDKIIISNNKRNAFYK